MFLAVKEGQRWPGKKGGRITTQCHLTVFGLFALLNCCVSVKKSKLLIYGFIDKKQATEYSLQCVPIAIHVNVLAICISQQSHFRLM